MNQVKSSKFVPTIPDDDDISTQNPADTANIYEGVAVCPINDSDTFQNVKIRAKNLAQVNVQQKIADYIYCFFKDRFLTLPEDETLSIANEISNIIDVKFNIQPSDNDSMLMQAVITAKFDDKDIMNYLIKFFKERAELKSKISELKSQLDKVSKEKAALIAENTDLKRQIDELQYPKANNLSEKERNALAIKKCDEAWLLYRKNDFAGAIKLYSEAIALNPNCGVAHLNRGRCYQALGEYEKAKEDLSRAKKLGW